MADDLDPTGDSITVGDVTLRTPGLTGDATYRPGARVGSRAARGVSENFSAALSSHGVEEQASLEIDNAVEAALRPGGGRGPQLGPPTIELDVQAPPDDTGQFVIYSDESGVVNWSFAEQPTPELARVRGPRVRTYVMRGSVPPAGPMETRGVIGTAGTKIIRVLVFPLVDPIVGRVSDYFAAAWEKKHRPYAIRPFAPDNYDRPSAQIDTADWSSLAGGRALLMIHGTGSQTHTGFAGLPRAFVQDLWQSYHGRVFAFDHPTISQTPRDNASQFASQMPAGLKLELDVVCHSRGGLVARVLSEKQHDLGISADVLQVKRVIFVGVPNAGTILTDARYMRDYLDSYTNLLTFVPDNAVVDTLQVIIAVAKQLAVGALKGLDGLECMVPAGDFLRTWLNLGPKASTDYFALASNYTPQNAGLAAWAKDRLIGDIFKAENDLVVPTIGVYDGNGSDGFPITERHVFEGNESVPHSGYFANEEARQLIAKWLG